MFTSFSQNPQCEGINQSRIIFNSRVADPKRPLYEIKMDPEDSVSYVLEAGEAHGISIDAQFVLFLFKLLFFSDPNSDQFISIPLNFQIANDLNQINVDGNMFLNVEHYNVLQKSYLVTANYFTQALDNLISC